MPLKYYGDSPAAFRTVNVANTAAVSGLQTLSSKLSSFSESFFKVAAEQAAEEGTNQAIQDIASGKEAKILDGFSYFNKAYNTASKAAYEAQVTADFKSKSEELSKTSETPEQLATVYGGYTNQYLSKVTDPTLKSLATISANKYMQNAISDLTVRNYEKTQKATLESVNLGISNLQTEIGGLDLNDPAYAAYLGKLDAYVNQLVTLKQLTPEGAIEKKKLILTESSAMRFVNAASSTDDDTVINNSIVNINGLNLSPKQKYEYINQITSAHQANFEALNVDLKNNNTKVEMVSKSLLTSIEGKILSNDISGAQAIFNQNLDKLNYADGLKIKETFAALAAGPQISDANAVLEYEKQGSQVNKDALMSDSRVSYADKRRIMGSAATLKAAELAIDGAKSFKMANGQSVQQAYREMIKNAFPKSEYSNANDIQSTIQKQVATLILNGKSDANDVITYTQQLIDTQKESMRAERESKIKANKKLNAKKAFDEYENKTSTKILKNFNKIGADWGIQLNTKTLKDFEEQ